MRVLLVPNAHNEVARAATTELATWLAGAGAEPALAQPDAEALGLTTFGIPPSDVGEPALAVALGGDGTILKAFHLLGEVEVPLLGVKFGRLGFMAGATPDTMRAAVESALAGEARIERRTTLRAELSIAGRDAGCYRAMNEIVVSRGASARVIAIGVAIDGRPVAEIRADGLVVSTATGSTAYALSAGGPIVAPSHGGMVVVPVAPHTLQARAIVTGPSEVVELTLPEANHSDACLLVDGEVAPCRRALERVIVTRDPHDVLLVKYDGRSFYDTVADEFFGG